MKTAILSTLPVCLCLFAASLWAKPKSMAVDTTFDQCGWAAEVTILDVGDAIRVRVTEDSDAIYRGHQLVGATVDVQPIAAGEQSCSHDLRRFVGTRSKLLMVTSREGKVQLVGSPETVDDGPGYHLRTWFDYNAIWFYSNDKEFGQAVGDRFDGVYAVKHAQIAKRFSAERKQLMLTLAHVLLRPRPDLPEAKLIQLIAQLGDDEFYVRERAQRRLQSLPPTAVEFLQQQARSSDDLEIANRLGQVIRAIQSPLQRHALAIRERGPTDEARVLLTAHDATTDAKTKAAIIERLLTLASKDAIDLQGELTTPGDVLSAWRDVLK